MPSVAIVNTEYMSVVQIVAFSALVGLLVGFLRALIDDKGALPTQHFVRAIRTIAASILVAALFGLTVYDYTTGVNLKVALTGICAYVAADILTGLQKISAMIASDPIAFIQSLKELVFSNKKAP